PAAPDQLALTLDPPNPPQGVLPEVRNLALAPGETAEAKALDVWAEALGAHALGVVFAPGSRRRVDPDAARAISQALGPMVVRVGVFRDQGPEEVLRLM
ncbi:hypothetical protein L6232_22745, partial [Shewanella sp. C31]|nr:hypothetical protein [Shewanella electrica]